MACVNRGVKPLLQFSEMPLSLLTGVISPGFIVEVLKGEKAEKDSASSAPSRYSDLVFSCNPWFPRQVTAEGKTGAWRLLQGA
jgi:hypothetical protein